MAFNIRRSPELASFAASLTVVKDATLLPLESNLYKIPFVLGTLYSDRSNFSTRQSVQKYPYAVFFVVIQLRIKLEDPLK